MIDNGIRGNTKKCQSIPCVSNRDQAMDRIISGNKRPNPSDEDEEGLGQDFRTQTRQCLLVIFLGRVAASYRSAVGCLFRLELPHLGCYLWILNEILLSVYLHAVGQLSKDVVARNRIAFSVEMHVQRGNMRF